MSSNSFTRKRKLGKNKLRKAAGLPSDSNKEIQAAIVNSLNHQGARSFSKIAQLGHKYSIIKFCSKVYQDPYDEARLRINLEVEDVTTGENYSVYMAHGVVTTLQRILTNLTRKYGHKVDLKNVTGLVVLCTGFHDGSGKLEGQRIATLEYEVGGMKFQQPSVVTDDDDDDDETDLEDSQFVEMLAAAAPPCRDVGASVSGSD
jgi:hypothetical protein